MTTRYLFKEPTFLSRPALCEWDYCLQFFSSVLKFGRCTTQVMVFSTTQSYRSRTGSPLYSNLLQSWPLAGQIWLEKELSYQLCFSGHSLKAFRTNLEKRWQLHTCKLCLELKGMACFPWPNQNPPQLSYGEENLTASHTSILRYYNNSFPENKRAIKAHAQCRIRAAYVDCSTLKGKVWSEALVNHLSIHW